MAEVILRGMRQGLWVVLPEDAPWDKVLSQLATKLESFPTSLAGTAVRVDAGSLALSAGQLRDLRLVLAERFDVSLAGLALTHHETLTAAQEAGVPVVAAPGAAPEATLAVPSVSREAAAAALPGGNALYVRQTLRSGASLSHDGAIVVLGDVNPGAEIVASGDIVVFGTLRGVAHAGSQGDLGAQIVAWALRPTQLRIGHLIARSPDGGPTGPAVPECARVEAGAIHIHPLKER